MSFPILFIQYTINSLLEISKCQRRNKRRGENS